jgi:peptide/nickel transport system permease protein
MGAFLIRRILQMIPLIFGVTLITFVIINASGSPFEAMTFDPRIKGDDIARLEESFGLNKPIHERYITWVTSLAKGDLGISLKNRQDVTKRILDVLPNTLLLSASALIISFVIAVPIGVLMAVKRNSLFDRIANIGAVAGFAVPTVWLSLMLIVFFAVQAGKWGLPTLPTGGVRDVRGGGGFGDRLEHLILPVTAIAIPQMAGWIVYVRSAMLEVIRQDYVRTAQAKGLSSRVVFIRHAFRNAVLPLVTLIGLSFPDLFAGAFIVENVFAYNGMGRLTLDAVSDKDYPVVMGTTLMFAVLVMVGNLLADVLYSIVDPRIRYD